MDRCLVLTAMLLNLDADDLLLLSTMLVFGTHLTPTPFQLPFCRAGGLSIALSHPPYLLGPVISPASTRLTVASDFTP